MIENSFLHQTIWIFWRHRVNTQRSITITLEIPDLVIDDTFPCDGESLLMSRIPKLTKTKPRFSTLQFAIKPCKWRSPSLPQLISFLYFLISSYKTIFFISFRDTVVYHNWFLIILLVTVSGHTYLQPFPLGEPTLQTTCLWDDATCTSPLCSQGNCNSRFQFNEISSSLVNNTPLFSPRQSYSNCLLLLKRNPKLL